MIIARTLHTIYETIHLHPQRSQRPFFGAAQLIKGEEEWRV
jgi:hypothetical protein